MKKIFYLLLLIALNASVFAQDPWGLIPTEMTEAKDTSNTNEKDSFNIVYGSSWQPEGYVVNGENIQLDTTTSADNSITNEKDSFQIVHSDTPQPEGWVTNGNQILIDTTKAADELPTPTFGSVLYYNALSGYWEALTIGGAGSYLKSLDGSSLIWGSPTDRVPFTGAMYDVDLNTKDIAAGHADFDSMTVAGLEYPRLDGDSLDVMYTKGNGELGFMPISNVWDGIDSLFDAYSEKWLTNLDTIPIQDTAFWEEDTYGMHSKSERIGINASSISLARLYCFGDNLISAYMINDSETEPTLWLQNSNLSGGKVLQGLGFYIDRDGVANFSGLGINDLNFPTSDGSANQVLYTDGSNNIGFTDQLSSPWTEDANGINYQSGNLGMGTESKTSARLFLNNNSAGACDMVNNSSTYPTLSLQNVNTSGNVLDGIGFSISSRGNASFGTTVLSSDVDDTEPILTLYDGNAGVNNLNFLECIRGTSTYFKVENNGQVTTGNLTLPITTGSNGQLWSFDGSGNIEFINVSSLQNTDLSSGAAVSGAVLTADGAGGSSYQSLGAGLDPFTTISGTTPTITNGSYTLTLSGNTTITVSMSNGARGDIIVTCGATAYTLNFSVTPKYLGSLSSYTPTANQTDIISYRYDGTNLYLNYGEDYN